MRSQQRAVAAHEAGRFADELVPVTVPGRRGQPDVVVDRDEHPRADTTLEQLAALRPVRAKLDAESTVTAGNASGQNDGAAMCVVTTPRGGRAPRAAPAARPAVVGRRRRRPRGHGHRPGPRHRRCPRPRRPHPRRHGPHRAQRGVRRAGARLPARVEGRRRPTSASTPTAPASPSATPSAPPAPASSPRWPTRCSAARPATASRPCASAAARASPRSSSGSPHECRRRPPMLLMPDGADSQSPGPGEHCPSVARQAWHPAAGRTIPL